MGRVERIHLVAEHGGPPVAVEEAAAEAGLGLRGDRHHGGPPGGDLTLIEMSVLERLAVEHGLDLTDGASRRNLVIGGLDLGQLVGRRFRVGEVVCIGEELCEPCAHLASLTDPVVLRGLVHSGLRASIAESGVITVGDVVELVE